MSNELELTRPTEHLHELITRHSEELHRSKRCGVHSGQCPDCPEYICPVCEGSGYNTVAAVEGPDGPLEVGDRTIKIPCVECHTGAGGDRRWERDQRRRLRLWRPDGILELQQIIDPGMSYEARPHVPFMLGRVEVNYEAWDRGGAGG